MLTHGEQPADDALMRRRLEAAIAFRESLGIDATAYRLVHGEADLLPSLIVDRYGDYLVVQALSQGMDRLLPAVVAALNELLQPRGILARNDPRARLLEGLEQRVDVLAGEVPETVTVTETGIEYDVDLRRGQKTGLFLDQRENRAAAAALRARPAARLLQLQRRLRAGAGPPLRRRRSRSTSPRTRSRASGRTRRATASPSTRASATCSTSCAGSSGSASGSTRSCSTRRRSRRTRRRSRRRRAGYKEINLRALKLLNAGRHARHLQLLVQRQRGDVRRDRLRGGGRRAGARDGRREADAGPRSSRCCSACPRPTT